MSTNFFLGVIVAVLHRFVVCMALVLFYYIYHKTLRFMMDNNMFLIAKCFTDNLLLINIYGFYFICIVFNLVSRTWSSHRGRGFAGKSVSGSVCTRGGSHSDTSWCLRENQYAYLFILFYLPLWKHVVPLDHTNGHNHKEAECQRHRGKSVDIVISYFLLLKLSNFKTSMMLCCVKNHELLHWNNINIICKLTIFIWLFWW